MTEKEAFDATTKKASSEYERFKKTMTKVLKMSKTELNKRLEAEKRSKSSASPGPAAAR